MAIPCWIAIGAPMEDLHSKRASRHALSPADVGGLESACDVEDDYCKHISKKNFKKTSLL